MRVGLVGLGRMGSAMAATVMRSDRPTITCVGGMACAPTAWRRRPSTTTTRVKQVQSIRMAGASESTVSSTRRSTAPLNPTPAGSALAAPAMIETGSMPLSAASSAVPLMRPRPSVEGQRCARCRQRAHHRAPAPTPQPPPPDRSTPKAFATRRASAARRGDAARSAPPARAARAPPAAARSLRTTRPARALRVPCDASTTARRRRGPPPRPTRPPRALPRRYRLMQRTAPVQRQAADVPMPSATARTARPAWTSPSARTTPPAASLQRQ